MPRGREDERVVKSGRREVRLSSGDRVLFPAAGVTKGDLWDYYRAVAPAVLPHLRDRPFTMKRFREGIGAGSFFQKDAPKGMPDWIETFAFETRRRGGARRLVHFPLVDSAEALLWMVQMHCIDLNVWTSRTDRPERPDTVVFDLDPPDDGWPQAVTVAHLVRDVLREAGLESWAKTSGAGGIHVVAPVARRATYADARAFAEDVAGLLARRHPDLVTTEWRVADRGRGVLIDAAQNGLGRTMATVWSVRPKPGASVSTPVAWDDLTESLDWRALGMDEAVAQVRREGDAFAPVLAGGQSLAAARRALAGKSGT